MDVNTSSGRSYTIYGYPDKCPYCHKSITPNVLFGHKPHGDLEVLMHCPDGKCGMAFIAYYDIKSGYYSGTYANKTSQGTLIGKPFSEKIKEISPSFNTIYNQAYAAEQQNLTEICGVGYRKALEFLIKDYAILNNAADKEKIEKIFLGNVIETFVNDSRVKSVAKRAAWLGNDETHYVRKWEGKNLEDLKKLIELTVHWIEMEALTLSFENDMPA